MTMVRLDEGVVDRRAFWDRDVLEQELKSIFKSCWLFVAHESEIAQPGDYVTRKMGRDPVIVTRDENGRPRVFLNTCVHRGSELCGADRGNTSHFRCSYHGWTYSNAGELKGVPEVAEVYGGKFDKSNYSLFEPPRVEEFCGLIFANWDAGAPSLDDYLADIKFYLEASFAKTEFEVIGSPGRGLLKSNWKIGVDNYCGDGYHLNTTHKTPIDLGVFGTGREMENMEGLGRPPSHCIDGGNGHTVRVQQLPVKFEQPSFLGYPPEMWPEFERNLKPRQVEMMSGLAVMHGNVFPNLSFLDSLIPDPGAGDTPPSSFVHLRQWQPIDVDRTELLVWCFVPKHASQEFKLYSQRAFTRTLGFGGIFETDDFQNWVSMATGNAGNVAQEKVYVYLGGAHEEPCQDVDWPGTVYSVDHTETNQRAVWRRWGELMDGAI